MGIEGDVVSCLYEIVKVKENVKENVGVSQKQENRHVDLRSVPPRNQRSIGSGTEEMVDQSYRINRPPESYS
jgi:hypothetical protein